jgi:hypothetical protein
MDWKPGDMARIKGTGGKVWIRDLLPKGRYRVQQVAPAYSQLILTADQLGPCD